MAAFLFRKKNPVTQAPTHIFDVLVLGAGAAGLMCAIEAGKRGQRVALLDHADRIGKKILISGGGRYNFTNLHCKPENFLSANPHFAKSALARYTPQTFLALVQKHKIAYHEKKLGQLFCDQSAQQIVTLLEQEAHDAGVQIFLHTQIPAGHTQSWLSGDRAKCDLLRSGARRRHRRPVHPQAGSNISWL